MADAQQIVSRFSSGREHAVALNKGDDLLKPLADLLVAAAGTACGLIALYGRIFARRTVR